MLMAQHGRAALSHLSTRVASLRISESRQGHNVVSVQVVPQATKPEVGFARQLSLFRLTRKSGRPAERIGGLGFRINLY